MWKAIDLIYDAYMHAIDLIYDAYMHYSVLMN